MSLNRDLELDRPIEDVKHELVLNVVRTANALSQAAATLLRGYDLTVAQFNVLFSLKFKTREWTQSDLGKRLVVTRASVTSVLDKLERKGLVSRDAVPGNRRIYHVSLTAEGSVLVDTVEPVYRAAIHQILANFDPDMCRKLINRLEQVREHLGAQG